LAAAGAAGAVTGLLAHAASRLSAAGSARVRNDTAKQADALNFKSLFAIIFIAVYAIFQWNRGLKRIENQEQTDTRCYGLNPTTQNNSLQERPSADSA
jgi:hypothetical protein